MRVYVNNHPVELLPGMGVRHALVGADLLREVEEGRKVYDDWGNEVGLNGAVFPEMKIWVK